MNSVTKPAGGRAPARDGGQSDAVEAAVAAAVEALLEGGESITTLGVQRIAQQAGISRATFYRYFPSKTEMLMRVTQTATAELFGIGQAWFERFSDREALRETLLQILAQRRQHGALIAAVEELAAYEPDVAAFWRGLIEENAAQLAERLREGQRTGLVSAEIDPATTASFVLWGIERYMSQAQPDSTAADDAGTADRLSRTIWPALGRTDG